MEMVYVPLEPALLRRIADGKKLELKVCNDEFAIGGKQLAEVKKMVAMALPPADASAANPVTVKSPLLRYANAVGCLEAVFAAKPSPSTEDMTATCGAHIDSEGRLVVQDVEAR